MRLKNGTVFWITGLSGAGKTTIGKALYDQLLIDNKNLVILDGDVLKHIVNVEGYSFDARLKKATSYSRLTKALADQGVNVIICTISMFDEVRNWNRENIQNYVEVFLDVDMSVLYYRNQKGLYSNLSDNNVAGVNVEVQLPQNPDIVINNNGDISVSDCIKKIITETSALGFSDE